ncbi:hypothetical protein EJB05_49511 [Eragrostis curvula]|uniref:Uncharacterized protein n=1 Tax=Eragrostis curvula TaxID=38414 RepID=A0A5J9T4X8_9POAL|nr:hypothetical protein EJB05_49511 [Eragrostis curvula]
MGRLPGRLLRHRDLRLRRAQEGGPLELHRRRRRHVGFVCRAPGRRGGQLIGASFLAGVVAMRWTADFLCSRLSMYHDETRKPAPVAIITTKGEKGAVWGNKILLYGQNLSNFVASAAMPYQLPQLSQGGSGARYQYHRMSVYIS